MVDINTNFIKERAEASISSTIQGAKVKVAQKEEEYNIAKAMFDASNNKLATLRSQMGSYSDNSGLKDKNRAIEAEVSNNWINFDVAMGSLGNSRNYYNKMSIFEYFMS